MAILDTTKDRAIPLEAVILGRSPDLVLVVRNVGARKIHATAPFMPGHEDEAAEDVARQLTLDGQLPFGMGES